MQYSRQEVPTHQGASPSFLAIIVSGVTVSIALIVHIAGIAVPFWFGNRSYNRDYSLPEDGSLWSQQKPSREGDIDAVRAMVILGLLAAIGGVAMFVLILVRGKVIWSTQPLRRPEKAIVIGFVLALFTAGLLILVGVAVFSANSQDRGAHLGSVLCLISCLIFFMGSGLSGKAAADIILNRE